MKLAIFDNKGITFDRYTVFIGNDVYGMSHNPTSPQGFNQYCGALYTEVDESAVWDNSEEVELQTLPQPVIKAIVDRLKDYEIA